MGRVIVGLVHFTHGGKWGFKKEGEVDVHGVREESRKEREGGSLERREATLGVGQ